MVTLAVPGSQPSTGLTEHPEQNDVKEDRRAKLRRTFDQFQKCFAAAFYTGAAVVGKHIAALVSAEPCTQRIPWRSQQDRVAATAAGYGLKATTCSLVASADVVRGSVAKAGPRRAHVHLKKCVGRVLGIRLEARG